MVCDLPSLWDCGHGEIAVPLHQNSETMTKEQAIFRRAELLLGDDAMRQAPIDPDDRGNGSIVHITAVFGFVLAGLVVQDAVK